MTEDEGRCLLCGSPATVRHLEDGEAVVWDLCDTCNAVAQSLADSLARR